jgi:DNA-binding transcriptional regulator YdaS (Cro superfamily)
MTLTEYLAQPGQSQQKLADRLGVTQSAVSQWAGGARMTAERVRAIVRATDGLVTAHDLRPDLFPPGFAFPADDAALGVAA